jgi:hypothetical protein
VTYYPISGAATGLTESATALAITDVTFGPPIFDFCLYPESADGDVLKIGQNGMDYERETSSSGFPSAVLPARWSGNTR